MTFFKKFLKRKQTIRFDKELEIIKENPSKLFQINIVRENFIEFQIYRQNSLHQFGLFPENEEGFMIILVFNPKNPNYNHYVDNFKKSKYHELMKIGVLDNSKFPILLINGDYHQMNKFLKEIQVDVFNYVSNEKYYMDIIIP